MFQEHHVLSTKFAGHQVIRLLGERFNHNAVRNLIALPSSQEVATKLSSGPHTGGHLGTYYDGFFYYLETLRVSPKFDAASAGDVRALDEIASDVNALVAAAKYAVANGHLLPNTPKNMTKEEANGVNSRWFSNYKKYAADNAEQIRQMQETVDQYSNAGQRDAALYLPILSPTSRLSMAERIELVKRLRDEGSPISLQFTNIGPVPDLPGLVPPLVDTRLPGFIPPSVEGASQPEGFTRSDPRFAGTLPAFPVPDPNERQLGQLPPSTAMPPPPQVLQFNGETSDLMRWSDGLPMMGPDPYNLPHDPADNVAILSGMAIFGALMAAPSLLPLLPALAPIVGLGLAGAAAGRAEPTRDDKGGPSAGETSSDRSSNAREDTSTKGNDDRPSAVRPAASQAASNSFDQGPVSTSIFDDRFGRWSVTPNGMMPDLPSGASERPVAGAVGPEEVRRLTRMNSANAGSVFETGSTPVPYLPPANFNDRFGNWRTPINEPAQQASKPIGAFTNEPSYLIPPPIFGMDDPGKPRNDADEWFSRWIGPLL